jgi:hypothetical protein
VGLLVDPPGGSAAATLTMRELGFTQVVDGGGLSELVGSRSCRSGLSPTAVMMER